MIVTSATTIATIESETLVATIDRILAFEDTAPEAGAVMAAELGMPVPAETEETEPSLPRGTEDSSRMSSHISRREDSSIHSTAISTYTGINETRELLSAISLSINGRGLEKNIYHDVRGSLVAGASSTWTAQTKFTMPSERV